MASNLTGLAVGDEVCVDTGLCETCCTDSPCGPAGAFGEYAVALADTVAKRDGLSSKDLVGLPLAGLTSYQAIFTGAGRDFAGAELGKLSAGQKLLVLGVRLPLEPLPFSLPRQWVLMLPLQQAQTRHPME